MPHKPAHLGLFSSPKSSVKPFESGIHLDDPRRLLPPSKTPKPKPEPKPKPPQKSKDQTLSEKLRPVDSGGESAFIAPDGEPGSLLSSIFLIILKGQV